MIMNEASQEEMNEFYHKNMSQTIEEVREAITFNYNDLIEEFSRYSTEVLFE